MSRLEQRVILQSYGISIDEPAAEVPPPALLHLWLADTLTLTVAQKMFVLDTIRPEFERWLAAVAGEISDNPLPMLVFTDNRYFAYTGSSDYYDLETGQQVKCQRPPVISIAYNLAELYFRRYLRATHAEHATTTVDSPR